MIYWNQIHSNGTQINNNNIINTLLYADYKVLTLYSEDNLWKYSNMCKIPYKILPLAKVVHCTWHLEILAQLTAMRQLLLRPEIQDEFVTVLNQFQILKTNESHSLCSSTFAEDVFYVNSAKCYICWHKVWP